MIRVLLLVAVTLLPSLSWAADGILPGQTFKVPFAVDGKTAVNRATVTVDAKGVATLSITYLKAGDFADAAYTLTRIDGPGPTPTPEPAPVPLPVEKLWGVVVYESSAQTPQQAIVLLSSKVRGLFAGEQFRVIDKDTKTTDPWQSYVDAAKSKKLPYLFLVDPEGTLSYQGELPTTVDATVALVAKYRKGGAK